MSGDQVLIAEDGDAGDGVHVLGMEKANELRQVGNVVALTSSKRVIEGDVDDAVAILDIEDNRVAPDFTPMSDNARAVITAGHDTGQVNRPDFKISCNWHRLLYNRRFENSGDENLFSGFEENALPIAIRGSDGFRQFEGSQILRLP